MHVAVRRFLRAFGGGLSVAALELENAVLRHQLGVLGRTVKRPPLRRRDRMLLAAVSTLLPRERWSVFLVSPQTLWFWSGSSSAGNVVGRVPACASARNRGVRFLHRRDGLAANLVRAVLRRARIAARAPGRCDR